MSELSGGFFWNVLIAGEDVQFNHMPCDDIYRQQVEACRKDREFLLR